MFAAETVTYRWTVTDSSSPVVMRNIDFTITVNAAPVANIAPAFVAGAAIGAATFYQDTDITPLTLPRATGGEGAITYALTPPIPGMFFDTVTGVLSGAPTTEAAATTYTYTAGDTDGSAAGTDESSLTISITVLANTIPEFSIIRGPRYIFTVGTPVNQTLPEATGGDDALVYTITRALPDGLTFNAAATPPTITGTPTTASRSVTYRYNVDDSDANTAPSDGSSISFRITVRGAVPTGITMTIRDLAGNEITSLNEGDDPTTFRLYFDTVPALSGFTADQDVTITLSTPVAGQVGYTGAASVADFIDRDVASTESRQLQLTVTDDDVATADGVVTYTATVSPSGFTATAMITLVDNEISIVTTPAAVTLATGATADYTVQLDQEPPGSVTVSVASVEDAIATVSRSTLVFTAANWNVPAPITVTGMRGGSTTISHSATAAGGFGYQSTDVMVTVTPVAVNFPAGTLILDQTFRVGTAVDLTLPTATGATTYRLSSHADRSLPAGLTFNAAARPPTLTGTPTAAQTAEGYAYSARNPDNLDNRNFNITVVAATTPPSSQTLSLNPTAVTESATPTDITATVTLTGGAYNVARSFSISSSTGTATEGTDYTALSNVVLTIPANSASGTVTFPFTAVDDMETEAGGEALTIRSTLLIVAGTDPDTSLAVANAVITIRDPVATNTAPAFAADAAVSAQTFTIGTAVDLTLPTATGGNNGISYTLTPAIPGLTLDTATGVLTGTPTTVAVMATHTYTAADGDSTGGIGDEDSLTFSVTVEAAAIPATGFTVSVVGDSDNAAVSEAREGTTTPVAVTATPTPAGSVFAADQMVTFMLTPASPASRPDSPDDPYVTYNNIAPRTIALAVGDARARTTFSLRPTEDAFDHADFPLTVTATAQPSGISGTATVTLIDNDITIETTLAATTVIAGATATYDVQLTEQPPADTTVTVASQGAGTATVSPATLTFTTGDWNTAQTVTVTGVAAGTTTIRHTAPTAAGYAFVTNDVDVTVTAAPVAPVFTNADDFTSPILTPENRAAVGADGYFAATGTGTVTYALTGADMARFTLSAAGTLTFNDAPNFEMPRGMAPATGNTNDYALTITATNSVGMTDATVTVSVTDVNEAPVVATITPNAFTEYTQGTFDIPVTDVDAGQTLTYALSAPNYGATLTGNTFTWTPGEDDGMVARTFSFTVTDSGTPPIVVTGTFDITATELANRAPTGATITGATMLTYPDTITLEAAATDADTGTTLTYTWSSDATGDSFDPATGTSTSTTWTPPVLTSSDAAVTAVITVTVSDGASPALTDTDTHTVTVNPPAPVDTAPAFTNMAMFGTPIMAAENQTAAGDANFFVAPGTVTLTLGGTDAARFTITDDGTLTFNDAPNFEMPRGMPFVADTNTNDYALTVTAMNAIDSVMSGAITVRVTDANDAPVLPSFVPPTFTEYTAGTLTLAATDEDRPAQMLTYTLTGEARGATISGNVFTWTPGEADGGEVRQFGITVTDDGTPPRMVVSAFNITAVELLNRDPAGAAITADASVTNPNSLPVSAEATDPDTGDMLTYAWTSSATGDSFTSGGMGASVTWNPPTVTAATMVTLTVTITDTTDGSVTATQVVMVNPMPDTAPSRVTLSVSPAVVTESATATTITVTATPVGGRFTEERRVTLSAGSASTATAGTDYTPAISQTITIPANAASGSVTIPFTATVDALADSGETVIIQRNLATSGGTAAVDRETTVTPATLTINDPAAGTLVLDAVSPQIYTVGQTVALTLPVATGGTTPYTYTLTAPDGSPLPPPIGLVFNPTARTLIGSPMFAAEEVTYRWTVSDSASPPAMRNIDFTITVNAAPVENTAPAFVAGAAIGAATFYQDTEITPLTLPRATGGEGAITYALTPAIPGMFFDTVTGVLSGAPTTEAAATTYTYTAGDTDGSAPGTDESSLTISITVLANTIPEFSIIRGPRYTFTVGTVVNQTLPEATGGDSTLVYTITRALPDGLTFNAAATPPTITGTPTTASRSVTYRYNVDDSDANEAGDDGSSISFRITIRGAAATGITMTIRDLAGEPITSLNEGDDPTTFRLHFDTVPALSGFAADQDVTITLSTPVAGQVGYTGAASVADFIDRDVASTESRQLQLTVTDDDVATADGIVTYTATVSPSGFTATAMITLLDNEISIVTTPSTVTLATAETANYTVQLDQQPPGSVTVSVASVADAIATVSRSTLVFTAANWNVPAPITVTGMRGGSTTISHSATAAGGFGYPSTDVMVTVTPVSVNFPAGTLILDQTFRVGTAVDLTLPTATGATTYRLSSHADRSLPAGLTFDGATRPPTLTGTPTAAQTAEGYAYSARNPDNLDNRNFNITVVATGTPPTAPSSQTLTLDPTMVVESATPTDITATVTLNGGTFAIARLFSFSSLNGTATAGTDYTSLSSVTLTVPANAESGTVIFPFTAAVDTDVEAGGETVSIRSNLLAPSGVGRDNALARAATTLTINDPPAATPPTSLSLSASPATVTESATDTDVTITATFVGGTFAEARRVFFETSGGTATPGVDYTSVSRTDFTIPANTASVDVVVPFRAIVDTIVEAGGETVVFTGALLVADIDSAASDPLPVTSATITIIDAAAQPVIVVSAGADQTVAPGDTITLAGSVTTSSGPAADVALAWSLVGTTGNLSNALRSGGAGTTAASTAASAIRNSINAITDARNASIAAPPVSLGLTSPVMFTVRLTGTAAGQQAGTDDVTITVEPPVAEGLAVSLSGPSTVAPGASVTLTATVTGALVPDASLMTAWALNNFGDYFSATNGDEVNRLGGAFSAGSGLTFTFTAPTADVLAGDSAVIAARLTVTDPMAPTTQLPVAADFTITVMAGGAADTEPEFAPGTTIATATYYTNLPITALTLPEATGGNGVITYTLTGPNGTDVSELPAGLMYTAADRTITGTPTATTTAPLAFTWTATDEDDDTDTLTFSITVEADTAPAFADGETITAQTYTVDMVITSLTLPVVETPGNGATVYALTPPAGLTFDPATRVLSGTPTATAAMADFTYTANDGDGNTAAGDADTLTFTITVEAATIPVTGFTVELRRNPGNANITEVLEGNTRAGNFVATPTPAGSVFAADQMVTFTVTPASPAARPDSPDDPYVTYDNIAPRTVALAVGDASVRSVVSLRPTDDAFDHANFPLTVTVTAQPSGISGTATITLIDNDIRIITTLAATTVVAGATTTYDVQLSEQPPTGTTVTLASQGTGTATVSPATLAFTTADWNTPRTVTVTGVAAGTTTIRHTAPDSAGYAFVTNDVDVTVTAAPVAPVFTNADDFTSPIMTPENRAAVGADGFFAATGATTYTLGGTDAARFTLDDDGTLTFNTAPDFEMPRGMAFASGTNTNDYALTVTAMNSIDSVMSGAITVRVTDVNEAPVFATITPPTFTEYSTDTITLAATDVDAGQMLTYRVNAPTHGATITGNTFTWTPGEDDGGVLRTFSLTVTDSGTPSMSATRGVNITAMELANRAPTGATITGATMVTSPDTITLTAAATDPDTGTTLTYTWSSDATGDSFDPATGTSTSTTWTPPVLTSSDAAVTAVITVTVSDGATTMPMTDTDTHTVTVNPPAPVGTAPSFGGAPVAAQVYTVGQTVALTLPEATGGMAPLTYTLTAPDGSPLPPPIGLVINPTARTLIGTPMFAVEEMTYRWTVTDSASMSQSIDFTITVNAAPVENIAPAFVAGAAIGAATFYQDTDITPLTLPRATGGEGAITYALTPPIPGMFFDTVTGVLSGAPTTEAAATTYTYTAGDTDGSAPGTDESSLTISITVLANTIPEFSIIRGPRYIFTVGTVVNQTLPEATGGDRHARLHDNPGPARRPDLQRRRHPADHYRHAHHRLKISDLPLQCG